MKDESGGTFIFSSLIPHPSSLSKRFLVKIYQFHGCSSGLKSFVAQFHTRAINRLIHVVGSDDSKHHRNAGFQTRLSNTARHFIRNVLEVRSLTANNSSYANNGIKLF